MCSWQKNSNNEFDMNDWHWGCKYKTEAGLGQILWLWHVYIHNSVFLSLEDGWDTEMLIKQ